MEFLYIRVTWKLNHGTEMQQLSIKIAGVRQLACFKTFFFLNFIVPECFLHASEKIQNTSQSQPIIKSFFDQSY